MVSLTTAVDRTDGVTFVRLSVENPDRERRVRVVNRLDGPVWPPRRQGRPAEGWTEAGYEGRVAASSVLTLGYASPAPPADPPAEIAAVEPVSGADRDADDAGSDCDGTERLVETETPTGVLRALGDPVVPRRAVPAASRDDSTDRTGDGQPDGAGVTTGDTSPTRTGGTDSDRARHPDAARHSDRGPAVQSSDRTLSERLAAIEGRLSSLESR